MNLLNALFRLFNYEWVRDETPPEKNEDFFLGDEEYEHLEEHTPRYTLRKIDKNAE